MPTKRPTCSPSGKRPTCSPSGKRPTCSPSGKHDQLMKELLTSFPDQFLRLAAPRIAEQIDLDAVEFAPEEHYPGSPTGRERRADLVARAPALPGGKGAEHGERQDVVLHAEIELRYRGRMAARLLSYHRGLSLKHALKVHTIVLYLRGGPPGPQAEVYEERSLDETVVTFRYRSLGLSRAPASEYLARPEPLAWALASLMRPAKGQSRPQLGLTCVRRIAASPDLSRSEMGLLFRCVWTYGRFEDDQAKEFDRIMAEIEDEEVQEMKMSMAEWWKKEGLEEGRKEGRKQGETSLLKRQLRRRFDELPKWIDQRLEQASRQELEGWAERVLDAKRLEDVISSA